MRGAGIFDKSELPEKPDCLATVTQDAWELLYRLSTHGKPVKSANNEKFISNESAQKSKESFASKQKSQDQFISEENKDDISVASSRAQAKVVNNFEGIIETILDN